MRPISRSVALAQMQQWIDEHRRLPSWSDWEHAALDRPSAKTIARRWGWAAFRAAAVGVPFQQVDELKVRARPAAFAGYGWTRPGLLRALIEHRAREGAWPRAKQWEAASTDHPSRRTYARRFGSWRRAIDEAALELALSAICVPADFRNRALTARANEAVGGRGREARQHRPSAASRSGARGTAAPATDSLPCPSHLGAGG